MCKTIFIEKYCYELVLAPLIKDLNILEQKGVFSNIDLSQPNIFGSLSLIIGDNLAQHSFGGFLESVLMSKGFLTIALVTETILNDEACQK